LKSRYTPKQAEAQARWDKTNIRRVVLKLVRTTDADILEWIESKDNMQGYLKGLIREDMKKEKEQ